MEYIIRVTKELEDGCDSLIDQLGFFGFPVIGAMGAMFILFSPLIFLGMVVVYILGWINGYKEEIPEKE